MLSKKNRKHIVACEITFFSFFCFIFIEIEFQVCACTLFMFSNDWD